MSSHRMAPDTGEEVARRPRVGSALDDANDAFHDAYDRARKCERRRGPVLVVLADELVVFLPDGRRWTLAVTPRVFHVIKSAAHVPIAIFAAIHDGDEVTRRDDETDHREAKMATLKSLRAHLDRGLASMSGETEADEETLQAIRTVLNESRTFVDRALFSEHGPARADVDAFARASGKRLLGLTRLATRIQLDALHAVVESVLGKLDEVERQHMQVVVTGDHQARARSLGMQYFRKRLREPEGAEERVAFAEGVTDADEALALVGTRRMDAQIAKAFFGDAKCMQRDVLGDAVQDLLGKTHLEPIGS